MVVNEWDSRYFNCFCSFHVATGHLKVYLSYTAGKKGQQCELERSTLPEFFKS